MAPHKPVIELENCTRCHGWTEQHVHWRQGRRDKSKWRLYRRCVDCGKLMQCSQRYGGEVPPKPDLYHQQELI